MFDHGHPLKLWECFLEIRKFQSVGPIVLVRRSKHLEDFEYLVNFTIPHKERSSLQHLCEYTTSRPEINTECVRFLSKKDLWASVPERDNFVSVGLDRQTESPCQAEIC